MERIWGRMKGEIAANRLQGSIKLVLQAVETFFVRMTPDQALTWAGVEQRQKLIATYLEGTIRKLKAERDGEIEVAGPTLAHSLSALGLIDEYRIYLHPVVLGHGKPYFAGPRPPLRLLAYDKMDEDVIRLTYVPAQAPTAPDGLDRRARPALY